MEFVSSVLPGEMCIECLINNVSIAFREEERLPVNETNDDFLRTEIDEERLVFLNEFINSWIPG